MSTKFYYKREELTEDNKIFSPIRSTIETNFYGNNVEDVLSISQAYEMAKESPGTIVTDMPVHKAEELGLPDHAKILLFNDGAIVGRYAPARVIIGEEGVDEDKYSAIAREAVYQSRFKKLYHTQTVIGLDEDFMVKAHLLIPEGFENTMYNWMLNFQYLTEEYMRMYKNSKAMDEGDIFVFSDPSYFHPSHPDGLALFDPEHNTALLLGMRYFGEHKKGTLTLAWGIGNRNGYVACHGGMKRYNFEDKDNYTIGVFGLSGSGKSTLTHARHDDKYDITILHDDAYLISAEDGSSVALEPTYFDKTQDYPTAHPDNKYLMTVQNCGLTLDEDGKKVIVASDIRNGNGRSIKSALWSPNRVNKIDDPVDSIAWIMKDSVIPPILRIKDPVLASVMGATLATKRTSAERLAEGVDINQLVIEPYANPFRTYPLEDDYDKFKEIFEERNVEAYVLNTGSFIDKDITKEVTLEILEKLANDQAEFKPFGNFSQIEYMDIPGYEPVFNQDYKDMWQSSINYRKEFLQELVGGRDQLPDEALATLLQMEEELK